MIPEVAWMKLSECVDGGRGYKAGIQVQNFKTRLVFMNRGNEVDFFVIGR